MLRGGRGCLPLMFVKSKADGGVKISCKVRIMVRLRQLAKLR